MKKLFAWFLLFTGVALLAESGMITFPAPAPKPGQKSVLGLKCEPIKNVRVAFVGAGNRGFGAIRRFSQFPDNTTVTAVSDLYERNIDKVREFLKKNDYKADVTYSTDPDGWKKFCERDDIDLVYVTTPPGLHAPIAIYAMQHGKHVVIEVPFASRLEDYWKIVDTAEQTQRHCMMLENCIYSDYILAVRNMIDSGIFGEPVQAEGAYLHDLRDLHFQVREGNWRLARGSEKFHLSGNTYPTHGIGGPAFWLNINRGDRMMSINSISTGCFSTRDYVARKLGKDHEAAKKYYASDLNTSIIRTANDKVIILFHGTNSPGPYSLGYRLTGTRGYTHAYPQNAFSFDPKAHTLMSQKEVEKLMDKYRHPVFKQFAEFAELLGGHGGIDSTMDLRLIYCLNNGLPLDMNVYDGATWSSLISASYQSVINNGAPVEIPDFTRGRWKTMDKVTFHMADPDKEVKLKLSKNFKPTRPAPVGQNQVEVKDTAGDSSNTAPVDFVSGKFSIEGENLVISYTSAQKIDPAKLTWHVKALISVGSKGGFDNAGAVYLAENSRLYKYASPSPGQWSWTELCKIKVNVKGDTCEMIVPLKMLENLPNRIAVRMRCDQDDFMPELEQPAVILCHGNVALDPETTVETSVSRADYSSDALKDGQIDRRLPWKIAAWASIEDSEDKFITFNLSHRTTLSRAIIYWEAVSRKITVEVSDGGPWKVVAEVKPDSDVTDINLSKAGEISRIRFTQKSGDGPEDRPDIMWVREVELFK